MCGIFYLKTKQFETSTKNGWNDIMKSISHIQSRGPDRTEIIKYDNQLFAFHRLAINGIDRKGDQPFCIINNGRKISLIVNGEIYNHKELEKKFNLPNSTGSDCEVILHLYIKFGLTETIHMLDGVFGFVLADDDDVYVGRDAIGVRPVFYRFNDGDLGISSIPIALESLNESFSKTLPIEPGYLYHFNKKVIDKIQWYHIPNVKKDNLFSMAFPQVTEPINTKIHNTLVNAIRKRLLLDRPFGCLLSGGLDSSLVASILTRLCPGTRINTFAIGFSKDATDLVAAKKVANFLNTKHHEVVVSMDDALASVPEVIKQLGTYDITTIRASVGMYLICKWIRENTDIKVLFSGEGSDELFCGYLYLHYAPNGEILEQESQNLVRELHMYDVLRADRTVSCNGLELRVPFLDKEVIQTALNIPGSLRHPKNGFSPIKVKDRNIEKYLLRQAFNDLDDPFIPEEVLWRRKEGFSDGVGNIEKPWYKHIQESVADKFTSEDLKAAKEAGLPDPVTPESVYYFNIYNQIYKNAEPPMQKHWMPKWQDTDDPSGRVMPAFEE